MKRAANFYIDAFNLYYGLRASCHGVVPYRWVNLARLCELLVPEARVSRIRYFTANIKPRPDDPGRAQRQQIYLRALRTLPLLTIHFGHYLESVVRMPVANPQPGERRTVEVIRTEEKGSDVNLATMLLVDSFAEEFELAVVISNDSDLALPIEVVRQRGFDVGILNPHLRRPSKRLRDVASFVRPIRPRAVGAAPFDDPLRDARGQIRKPPTW